MLYRAQAHVLFVLPAAGGFPVLSRLRPHRDRPETRQSRKPVRAARVVPDPIDDLAAYRPAPAPVPRPVLPTSDPADIFLLTLGRWKRVCSWWLFAGDEIEDMLSREWRH